jgi:septal ring factor EnvC (AmiA/AmiB activator)
MIEHVCLWDDCERCKRERQMNKCGHNEYWTGHYGTCMACRSEKAESQLAKVTAERDRLKAELDEVVVIASSRLERINALESDKDFFKEQLEVSKKIRSDKFIKKLNDARENANKDRDAWKQKAERLAEALKSCEQLDRTPEYRYGEPDRQGHMPGIGKRWKTPKEKAKEALAEEPNDY